MWKRVGTAAGVFVVSGALVLSTAPPAQAFDPGPVIVGTLTSIVGGSGATAAAAATGLCSTGVGCVVLGVAAAAAIGYGIYQTFQHPQVIPFIGEGLDTADAEPHEAAPDNPGHAQIGYMDTMDTAANPAVEFAYDADDDAIRVWWRYGAWYSAGVYQYDGHCSGGAHYTGNGLYYADSIPAGGVLISTATSGAFGDLMRCSAAGSLLDLKIWNCNYCAPSDSVLVEDFAYQDGSPIDTDNAIETETIVTCRNPDGSTWTVTVTGTTDQRAGIAEIPSCVDEENPDGLPIEIVIGTRPATGSGAYVEQIGWTVNGTPEEYPGCYEAGAHCKLTVEVDGHTCAVGVLGCSKWPSINAANPSLVDCKWGSYSVPMSWCAPLKKAYTVVTGTNIPENETELEGYPIGWPDDVPGVGTRPTTDVETDPPPTPPVPVPEVPNPTPEGVCGIGWGDLLNGVVVYKAFTCALSWAFVPSSAALASIGDDLSGAFDSTGVPAWVDAAGTVPEALSETAEGAAGGSCAGPGFSFSLVPDRDPYEVHPLSVCDEPMSTIAPIVRAVVAVGVVILGVRSIIRPVLASVDMGSAVK